MAEQQAKSAPPEGLTSEQYATYAALFIVLPGVCFLLSSILYYVWIKKEKTKAKQINRLGWIIFSVQMLLYILYTIAIGGRIG